MNKKTNILNLSMISIFTAIIVVTSFISIPMPNSVPITLQTFGVALAGFMLKTKKAPVSVLVYIALGLVGVPVFSGATAGFGKLLGLTGGFIWGFIFLALLCGLSEKVNNIILKVAFGIVGLIICDICGAFQYAILSQIGFVESFMLVAFPYLLKDIICVVMAFIFSKSINLALSKSNLINI